LSSVLNVCVSVVHRTSLGSEFHAAESIFCSNRSRVQWDIPSYVFSTVTLILSHNLYQNFVLVSAKYRHFFTSLERRKHYVLIVARISSMLTDYHTENFHFPVLVLKYLNLKN